MKKIEIVTLQIQEKTLPGWLRGHGYRLLIGEHLRHWPGPHIAGEHVVFAFSVHDGDSLESEGLTLWFFLPDGNPEKFTLERLGEAAGYVLERVCRPAHIPGPGFTSFVFPENVPPGSN